MNQSAGAAAWEAKAVRTTITHREKKAQAGSVGCVSVFATERDERSRPSPTGAKDNG